jgi:WD40 repeat protein
MSAFACDRSVVAHACRFLQYEAESVVASCLSPDASLLALCRESGNVELYNIAAGYCLQSILYAGTDCTDVRAACFDPCSPCRFYTAGLSGQVIEWDIFCEHPIAFHDAYTSAVYALAPHPTLPYLAAACADGAVRLFATGATAGTLSLVRAVPGLHQGRCLAVAWAPDGALFVSAGADGAIHGRAPGDAAIPDLPHRASFSFAAEAHGRKEPGEAFAVLPLNRAATVVAVGDSLGNVSIWASATGVQTATFRTHKAPVLALALTTCGSLVASGAIPDCAIVSRTDAEPGEPNPDSFWIQRGKVRAGTHDVSCLTPLPNGRVVAAGVDGRVTIFSPADAGNPRPSWTRFPALQAKPLVAAAVARSEDGMHSVPILAAAVGPAIEVWALPTEAQSASGAHPRLLTRVSHRCFKNSQICALAISYNAGALAVSTREQTRLFALDIIFEASTPRLAGVSRVTLPPLSGSASSSGLICPAASALAFAPIGSSPLLALGFFNGTVAVLRFSGFIAHEHAIFAGAALDLAVTHLAFSPDVSVLAAAGLRRATAAAQAAVPFVSALSLDGGVAFGEAPLAPPHLVTGLGFVSGTRLAIADSSSAVRIFAVSPAGLGLDAICEPSPKQAFGLRYASFSAIPASPHARLAAGDVADADMTGAESRSASEASEETERPHRDWVALLSSPNSVQSVRPGPDGLERAFLRTEHAFSAAVLLPFSEAAIVVEVPATQLTMGLPPAHLQRRYRAAA